jgi:hypothetical protein
LGSGDISPHIFDLGTTWSWVGSFTIRPPYPQRKSPCYPLERRMGGPQSRSGHGGEEKNSQTLPGLEPPIIQPVAQRYTTELSRLLFLYVWFKFFFRHSSDHIWNSFDTDLYIAITIENFQKLIFSPLFCPLYYVKKF